MSTPQSDRPHPRTLIYTIDIGTVCSSCLDVVEISMQECRTCRVKLPFAACDEAFLAARGDDIEMARQFIGATLPEREFTGVVRWSSSSLPSYWEFVQRYGYERYAIPLNVYYLSEHVGSRRSRTTRADVSLDTRVNKATIIPLRSPLGRTD